MISDCRLQRDAEKGNVNETIKSSFYRFNVFFVFKATDDFYFKTGSIIILSVLKTVM